MRSVQMLRNRVLSDILRLQLSRLYFLRDGAHGIFYFIASAVVDAQRSDGKFRPLLCLCVAARDKLPNIRCEHGQITNDLHGNFILCHRVNGFLEISAEQVHQRADFFLRTLPVLRGKCIHGKIFDANVFAVCCDGAECLCADLMSGGTRQPAFFCPASISVHNNRNMLRHWAVGRLRRRAVLFFQYIEQRHGTMHRPFFLNPCALRLCAKAPIYATWATEDSRPHVLYPVLLLFKQTSVLPTLPQSSCRSP